MGGMCLLPLEGGPSVTLANYMSTRGINSGLYCLFFQVFNSHFFQVTIDDLRPEPSKLSMLCHADSLGILPVQWCLKNGVSLTPPKGLYSGGKSRVCALQEDAGLSRMPLSTRRRRCCQHFRCCENTACFTVSVAWESVSAPSPGAGCGPGLPQKPLLPASDCVTALGGDLGTGCAAYR